jgi:transposase
MEARRMTAADLFTKGVPQADIARELNVAHQTVSDWHEKWAVGGKRALRAAGRAGRLPKVTPAQLAKVEKALQRGPKANGYPTYLWTLARVAAVIEETTGVRYHPGHVWRVLRQMGWSSPPSDRARRRRHRALGQRALAPGKKNARARDAWIVFQDESGFSLLPSVRATWAPRGQAPVLRHHLNNWKRLSMSAAVCFRPDATDAALVFGVQPGSYNDEALTEFLTELHQHLGGEKVTLIWDGLPSHRSRAMKRFIASQRRWLVVEPLPSYAYDLNPVEQVWGNLKGRELANLCPDTISDAAQVVDEGLCRIGRETQLCFAFLRHCGLHL